jgi:hypothetical protein
MKIRYFGKQELECYLQDQKIKADIWEKTFIGISSISDLIEICDQYKRDGNTEFRKHLSRFLDELVTNGFVFLSELDQQKLSSSLFENEDVKSSLWIDGSDRNRHPLQSVRCLTLRPNAYVFWDEDVYVEMQQYFE